jgi:hypothetical protein
VREQGAQAAQLLLNVLGGQTGEHRVTLPTQLIVRGTTGPERKARAALSDPPGFTRSASVALLRGGLRVPSVDHGADTPGLDVVHVAGDAHLRREQG